MNKKSRVVFSKNPAPTDNHVQEIYRSYRNFILNIRITMHNHVPDAYRRISIQKKRDGTYIPMLSVPLKLNSPDLERLQIYEAFFPLYLKVRNLLIQDMRSKLDSNNHIDQSRGVWITQIRDRMAALNLLCSLMITKQLNLSRLELFKAHSCGRNITGEDLSKLYELSEHFRYHPGMNWLFSRDRDFDRGDLFGDHQNSWWKYVKKYHPYKSYSGGFPVVSFNLIDT